MDQTSTPTKDGKISDNGGKTGPPTLNTKILFAQGREVIVEHGTERYRLLLTNSNKLLLVK